MILVLCINQFGVVYNYKSFTSKEEAIDFMLEESKNNVQFQIVRR